MDEGPVETFEALDIKGDKITLNWTYYDAIQRPSSDIVQLKIYQDNILEQTVDISYTQTSYDVLDRMFNTTYRFTLERKRITRGRDNPNENILYQGVILFTRKMLE